MKFSVIIPTRNRPALLKIAIASVIQQTFDDFEIIVVNDGSDAEYDKDYQAIEAEFKGKVTVLHLERSWSGHGQSYAINMGALKASGQYLCLLDDDDFWIDENHLATANRILCETNADVYFTNQQAFLNEQPTGNKLWLAPLHDVLLAEQVTPLSGGVFHVNVVQLMRVNGFEHLNTTIVETALFKAIKGLDENIRYECDRDFYNRLIDAARMILFNPTETSRHNIPDPTKTTNMSTLVSHLEKMLYRLYLLDKAVLFSKHAEIRRMAKLHKVYTLKSICDTLYKQQNYKLAAYYAKEAVCIGFNLKWLAFTLFVSVKAKIQ